ncbi:MAG: hypothetical protein ABI862_02620 [Ilumatobacteraceae bacterium]
MAALIAGLAVAAPTAQAEQHLDLTEGAVFAMSNARDGNTVVAYYRDADGTLVEQGRYATGGTGSGSFEDTANGLVLGTSEGEAGPNNLIELADGGQQLLFVTNAGSNSIAVFHVNPDGLDLVDVERSNGEKPVSITVNRGVAVVLNSGETNDDLFDADGNVIANCTTGHKPEVTGFTVSDDGDLTPIRRTTQKLSGESVSGCAQVSFTPDGNAVVVTERVAQPKRLKQQTSDNERLDDEGVLDVFRINRHNGRIKREVIDATGQGPFGFTFLKNGALLTTEQSDGPDGPGRGAAASYVFDHKGNLLRSSPSIQNGGTDTCWFVASDSQTVGFATSFFGEGRISSYELDEIGIVRLIEDVATGPDAVNDGVAMGASDLSFSGDSQYLYQLNSVNGTITVWANDGSGTLTLVEQQMPFPQPAFGPGMGMAAPLGLAAN